MRSHHGRATASLIPSSLGNSPTRRPKTKARSGKDNRRQRPSSCACVLGSAVTLVWIAIAIAVWGFRYENLTGLAILLGVALLIFWALSGLKVFRAIQSHHYRLTTRRLFVRTGFFNRRLDQIELLRVKDVFVHQSLLGKWLGFGHVVVVSSEQTLPRALLYGIDRPQFVMDLIWLRTRAELENKTSRVERV